MYAMNGVVLLIKGVGMFVLGVEIEVLRHRFSCCSGWLSSLTWKVVIFVNTDVLMSQMCPTFQVFDVTFSRIFFFLDRAIM